MHTFPHSRTQREAKQLASICENGETSLSLYSHFCPYLPPSSVGRSLSLTPILPRNIEFVSLSRFSGERDYFSRDASKAKSSLHPAGYFVAYTGAIIFQIYVSCIPLGLIICVELISVEDILSHAMLQVFHRVTCDVVIVLHRLCYRVTTSSSVTWHMSCCFHDVEMIHNLFRHQSNSKLQILLHCRHRVICDVTRLVVSTLTSSCHRTCYKSSLASSCLMAYILGIVKPLYV